MGRLAFGLLLLSSVASCGKPAGPEIHDAWTRDSVGGVANAAIFMTIKSDRPDRLLSASTPAAKRTDLMTMGGGGGVIGMKYVRWIDIPAGKAVSLDPTGLHVWLDGLHEPLRTGESFPLVLKFQNAGERQIAVSVIGPAAAPPTPG